MRCSGYFTCEFCLMVAGTAAQGKEGPKASATQNNSVHELGKKWEWFIGNWTGDGTGAPGAGGGSSGFQYDLQKQVIVRRSHTEFPKMADRPATVHHDLMVIHKGADADHARAVYFDNEGHVIQYAASWDNSGGLLTLVSGPSAGMPRFRLSYKKLGQDEVLVTFEMAAPGQDEAFKPYISGKMKRRKWPGC